MDRGIVRLIAAAAMVCACLLLPGCSCDSVPGTYTDAEGVVSVELKSDGKAYVTLGELGTNAGEWEQDGDRIVVKIGGDSNVLTLKEDGSLDGGMMLGTLKKKEE